MATPNKKVAEIKQNTEPVEELRMLNVYQKVAHIMSIIEKVEKTGWNEHQRYSFMEQAQIMATIRPKLAEVGLLVLPKIVRHEIQRVDKADGKFGWKAVSHMEFVFINCDKPEEQIVVPFVGEADDSQDKATNKSVTSCQKYMWIKLLMMSDKDDPDAGNKRTDDPANPKEFEVKCKTCGKSVTDMEHINNCKKYLDGIYCRECAAKKKEEIKEAAKNWSPKVVS